MKSRSKTTLQLPGTVVSREDGGVNNGGRGILKKKSKKPDEIKKILVRKEWGCNRHLPLSGEPSRGVVFP